MLIHINVDIAYIPENKVRFPEEQQQSKRAVIDFISGENEDKK